MIDREHYDHKLEALHNFEALLNRAYENGEIDSADYEDAMDGFISWMEQPTMLLLPEDNVEPPQENYYY